MKKTANMADVAERLLGCRIALPTDDDPMGACMEAALRGHRKTTGFTVAQAIVLAQGRKALNGDKSAAEFLQRLTAGAADASDAPMVIRVQMREAGGKDTDEDANGSSDSGGSTGDGI